MGDEKKLLKIPQMSKALIEELNKYELEAELKAAAKLGKDFAQDLLNLEQLLKDNNAKVISDIHDSTIIEVSSQQAESVKKGLEDIFKPKYMGEFKFPILPLKKEVSMGYPVVSDPQDTTPNFQKWKKVNDILDIIGSPPVIITTDKAMHIAELVNWNIAQVMEIASFRMKVEEQKVPQIPLQWINARPGVYITFIHDEVKLCGQIKEVVDPAVYGEYTLEVRGFPQPLLVHWSCVLGLYAKPPAPVGAGMVITADEAFVLKAKAAASDKATERVHRAKSLAEALVDPFLKPEVKVVEPEGLFTGRILDLS